LWRRRWTKATDHAFPAFLAISNGTLNTAHVMITLYNGTSPQVTEIDIAHGELYRLNFPTNIELSAIENPRDRAGSVTRFGTHITSDVKISAYYMFNSLGSRDIFTLKGDPALGTLFYAPMQSDNAASSSDVPDQIDIVATEDDTEVTVIPTTAIANTGHSPNPSPTGTLITRTLQKGGTLKIMEHTLNSLPSLAGTKIIATKPVAVTVTEDMFYVGGTADGTTVKIYKTTGTSTPSDTIFLDAGRVKRCDFDNTGINAIYVEASEPVYIYQRTGFGEEGVALLPSVYSISQTQVRLLLFLRKV
jgi:hypothetical protein